MGYARNRNYREGDLGMYHCTVRCVRQSHLTGKDRITKRSYGHRKEWIRSRLAFLVEVFLVEVVAYAVMGNHLHTVLKTRPDLADKLSPEEVAVRWLKIFPPRDNDSETLNYKLREIVSSEERVKKLRRRLGSLSWFNKLMNENIARRANAEDNCTGHFWEGRFYCQKVLDIPGAIACSVYVDLNPIRAKSAKSPEESNFTSVQDRINLKKYNKSQVKLLAVEEAFKGKLSLSDYLILVDVTARIIISGKGSMSAEAIPIIERLGITADSWIETTNDFKAIFCRVVGSKQSIRAESIKMKAALRGVGRSFSAAGH